MPLKVAAKVDRADQEYFETEIRQLFDDPLVEFIGEISEREKNEFLGNAAALLFPIDWQEPFGLVMIEAMACGTPVIAFRGGSVDEVVDNGITGFIVENIDEAIRAVEDLSAIRRKDCRRAFETRFSASRMVKDYLKIYDRLIGSRNQNSDLEYLIDPDLRTTR